METTVKKGLRRYRIDENPVYNDRYDHLILNSSIFNSDNIPNVHTMLNDKKNLQSEIFRYHGDEHGLFDRAGSKYRAYIPAMQDQLNKIETQFEELCIRMVNEGYSPLDQMPEDMLTKKYEFEARIDVREKELIELQKRLASYTDEAKNVDNANLLKYGLMGEGRLQDGILVEIDGQKVIQYKERLIIENGKYAGMSVPDFRKLIVTWQAFRKEEDAKKLLQFQEEFASRGEKFYEEEYSRFDSCSYGGGRPVSASLLPDWPEGVKNWLEEESEE